MIDYPVISGKVRDTYDIGNNKLVVVATDRLSAFDYILPSSIPYRGPVLTKLTKFWADQLSIRTHVLSDNPADMPKEFRTKLFEGRTLLVEKCEIFPFECVVRGFLSGSGWDEYKKFGTLGKQSIPFNIPESSPLIPPKFTPATKEKHGHDVNISMR